MTGTVLLAACVTTAPHLDLARPTPVFSPNAFFGGDTIGVGVLSIDIVGKRATHVSGHGTVDPDGTLVLVQRVRQGSKPESTRTWHIRSAGGDRFTGTLTDAVGPVDAYVRGNLLHIAYASKGGLKVEQWLYLQPGEKVALNRMVVRKLGLPIASLDETITKR